jgi:class 3 adenylate cyclase
MAVCSACGVESPEGFRFCGGCGAALDGGGGERRERRVVSVLMADLKGFTARSERLDVEDVDAFLAPYRELLRGEVERTGGVVSDFAGDGMMAVFGAPVAHEDDPERAVRAALAIGDGFAYPESDAAWAGLHVRLGVTTGEVLVTLEGARVRATGDAVNTAARLEAAAPEDGVLVDEVTYRATNRTIQLEPSEPVYAKGKAEPVPAWLALEPRSRVPEQARLGGLALVGREMEVGILRSVFDRSRSESSTQLVSVIGEPGIGKSRLVEELAEYVQRLPEMVTWRVGRSLSYGEGVAFWALGEMVKSQAGILESDSAGAVDAKLGLAVEALVVDEGDRGWVRQHLGPLVGLGAVAGEHGRVEAFAAWRRFFEAIAEDCPAVLVFEDLHWADDALLDFIDLLADRAGGVPLVLVCTARPEVFERREHWGGGKLNSTTILLSPLSGEDTARLVGDLLDQALLPAEVQQALLARAEGNPLYVQEYVRMLRDRALLVRGDGGWALTGRVESLPESIQGIIAARLDLLTDDEKQFTQNAAVIGRTAWIGSVCALSGMASCDAQELLHSLERKQLVARIRRSSISGDVEFSFGHALTKDVAYSQIRRADRAEKHEAAAGWIEELAGERDDKAEMLSDHYHEALTLRQALGEDTTHLTLRARDGYVEAARQAAATHAHAAAEHHYQAALELTKESDLELRAELMFGIARAVHDLGSAGEDSLVEARDALLGAHRWRQAGIVRCFLASLYRDRGELGQAEAELLAAEETARQKEPDRPVPSEIVFDQAFILTASGRHREVTALCEPAIASYKAVGADRDAARLEVWLGNSRLELGGSLDIVGQVEAAAQTLVACHDPFAAVVYGNLANIVRGLGSVDRSTRYLEESHRLATSFAHAVYLRYAESELDTNFYHAGRWAKVMTGNIAERSGTSDMKLEIDGLHLRARILAASGQTAAALADAATVIEYHQAIDDVEGQLGGMALRALACAAGGAMEDALAACTEFIAEWTRVGGMLARLENLIEVAPILAAADRHAELRAAATLVMAHSLWVDAALAIADGRYEDAADTCASIGSLPNEAAIRVLAAEQYMARHDAVSASRQLEAALAFYRSVGATAYLDQVATRAASAG